MKKVEEKRVDVNAAVGMGEVILSACHPDCITTIKHWITIIRARFEEVSPLRLHSCPLLSSCPAPEHAHSVDFPLHLFPSGADASLHLQQVLTWAKQHQQRLEAALSELVANAELLEELLAWIQWAETTLIQRDQEPTPQNIDQVKALIAEHQVSPVLEQKSFPAPWANTCEGKRGFIHSVPWGSRWLLLTAQLK